MLRSLGAGLGRRLIVGGPVGGRCHLSPRNAIFLNCSVSLFPLQAGENLGWLSSLQRASPHALGTFSFLINSHAL